MKTIFLCEDYCNVRNVYFEHDTVYNKEYVLKNAHEFSDTEVVFSTWGMPCFTEEEIKSFLPSLKAVFYAAGSVQNFARPFLKCGVKIFSAWRANAVPVAEYTVSQILLANKGFFASVLSSSYQSFKETCKNYNGNYKSVVGIVGVGMIGSLVCSMLKNFDLDILVYDPFLSDKKADDLGVTKTSLEEIFSRCDVVSNHLADNAETKRIFTKELFERMKPYATFINTGRGAQVIEEDLIHVLKKREDVIALLDVTEPEPPISGSELYVLKNCILTPHIAGSSGKELRRMAEYMMEEYGRFSSGEFCPYEVNENMLRTMA